MSEERDVKKVCKWMRISLRPVGRPKIRWMHNAVKDIQAMKIVDWKK
jgi:virulence-associated protein VapD